MTTAKRIFITTEALSGILLFGVLLLALLFANSSLYPFYRTLLDIDIQVRIGSLDINKPMLLWVNKGLMAIFFFLLTLEIKREALCGELSRPSQIILPVVAAIGGILLPIAIYLLINYQHPETLRGWPIATTTDIAFVLGIVSLLGKRVPPALKTFLVALSIIDDILAIIIIAVITSGKLSLLSIGLTLFGFGVLLMFNLMNITRIAPYVLVGLFIWVCVIKSGMHATLAGIIVALAIPMGDKSDPTRSPLRHLETTLHPWVAFFILPVFVFGNGGVPLTGITLERLLSPVTMGIALGLYLGKTFGVFGAAWLTIKAGYAKLPRGASWGQLFGLSILTGIGFTMSLFLGSLAFHGGEYEYLSRQGILLGSFLSAITGVSVLFLITKKKETKQEEPKTLSIEVNPLEQ